MASVEKVKFERWGVIKRYPDRSELTFMSQSFDDAHIVYLETLTAPRLYSDECYEVELKKIVEE